LLRERHGADQNKYGRTRANNRRAISVDRATNVPGLPPSHLGWGNCRLTKALAAEQERQFRGQEEEHVQPLCWRSPASRSPDSQEATPPTLPDNQSVRIYPDLALAFLRNQHAAESRIWLLLRFLDATGRGWIDIAVAKERLTQQGSNLHVCGWRQLRKLLGYGEGIFWDRANGRIWLHSVAKVAASLGVRRLTGRAVELPIKVLLQKIGSVRAHLYASFHSGRSQHTTENIRVKPIARRTLQQLTHIGRRTQRNYEKRAGVRRQFNFAIGMKHSTREEQDRAWKHGPALFRFTDHQGDVGQQGLPYTAWQLPNNYFGPHKQEPKGRQKRINRELADLFMKGMTGNGKRLVGAGRSGRRRFYDNGLLAAKSYNRNSDQDVYWRSPQVKRGQYHVWHLLPGQDSS
jgi:hypothetical protein